MGFGDANISAIINTLGLSDNAAQIPGWQKRLKQGAYTGPEGERIVFQFVDLQRTIQKRTTTFEFNGIDGKFVQDNGHDEGVYPLMCYFTGDDHDRIATAFEGLLTERGRGKLEHPMYGTIDVVPTGTIERQNLMVSAANQTTIMVTFSSTLADIYQQFATVPKSKITQTNEGFDIAAAAQFESDVDLSDPVSQAKMASDVLQVLQDSAQTIRNISNGIASAQRDYDNQARKITQSIDTLVTAPANLASQIIELIKSPARTIADIESKLAGYEFFSRDRENQLSDVKDNNAVALNNLVFLSATNASVVSANSQDFVNRPDALETALNVNRISDSNSAILDALFVDTGFIDTGGMYQASQKAVSQIIGKLVSDSFDLLVERIVYLQRDRNMVDVCSQFYGEVTDQALQRFIDTNRIGGEEMYILKRGRKISYYA